MNQLFERCSPYSGNKAFQCDFVSARVCICTCVHRHVILIRSEQWPISGNNAALLQITMTPHFQVIVHWFFTVVSHTQTIHPATSTLSVLAQDTITNYCRLGGLNNAHLFLTVMETGKSNIKVPASSMSSETPLLGLQTEVIQLHPHISLTCLLIRSLTSFISVPTFVT